MIQGCELLVHKLQYNQEYILQRDFMRSGEVKERMNNVSEKTTYKKEYTDNNVIREKKCLIFISNTLHLPVILFSNTRVQPFAMMIKSRNTLFTNIAMLC